MKEASANPAKDLLNENLTMDLASKEENGVKWKSALESEMQSFDQNETWTLVPRSRATNILSNEWGFRLKDDVDKIGSQNEKFKSRLVTQKFQ